LNKKFLLLATLTFAFFISGCDQELPQGETPPKLETPTVQPENPPAPLNENPAVTKENPISNTENPPPVTPPVETPNTATETPNQNANPVQPQKISLKIYYPDDAGINLVGVNRTVEVKNDADKYLAAVRLLMKNPEEKDLTVIFPKNAKINNVTFADGTAFVDFDKNITKSFVGGSTGEELLVNSVVKTLTEFQEVKQVRFLVDGKEIETLSGHMDLSAPIKKSDV